MSRNKWSQLADLFQECPIYEMDGNVEVRSVMNIAN